MKKLNNPFVYLLALLLFILASLACDIDQNFGMIIPDGTPVSFTPIVAEHHSWLANLSPGAKYKLIIATQGTGSSFIQNSLFITDEKGIKQYSYASGKLDASDHLQTFFIAPADGKIMILFVPGTGTGECTIQLITIA